MESRGHTEVSAPSRAPSRREGSAVPMDVWQCLTCSPPRRPAPSSPSQVPCRPSLGTGPECEGQSSGQGSFNHTRLPVACGPWAGGNQHPGLHEVWAALLEVAARISEEVRALSGDLPCRPPAVIMLSLTRLPAEAQGGPILHISGGQEAAGVAWSRVAAAAPSVPTGHQRQTREGIVTCPSVSAWDPSERVAASAWPSCGGPGRPPSGRPEHGSPLRPQPAFCHFVGRLRFSENPPRRPCNSYCGNQEGWAAASGTHAPGTGTGGLCPEEGPRGPAAKTKLFQGSPVRKLVLAHQGGQRPLRAAQAPLSAASSTEGGPHRPEPPGSAGMTQAVSIGHPGTCCRLVQPEGWGLAPLGAGRTETRTRQGSGSVTGSGCRMRPRGKGRHPPGEDPLCAL